MAGVSGLHNLRRKVILPDHPYNRKEVSMARFMVERCFRTGSRSH